MNVHETTVRAPAAQLARAHILSAPGLRSTLRRQQGLFALTLFVPVILLFLIIRVIPIVQIFLFSFTNYSVQRRTWRIVGFDNFVRLLSDQTFHLAFKNSMLFILYAVPIEIVLALALALLINRKLRLEGLYQTLFFLPYILPMVPAGIMWKWIYAPGSFGLANYALESLGLPRVGWLTDPNIALFAVVIMHVWKNLGFFVVIFLVGLKAISPEVVEAARVDGATEWQTIGHVQLPLLRPTILFGVVMGTIWSMSVFTEVYIMTQGTDVSAGSEMEVLVTTIYKEAFQYFNMGYAATVSLVLFAVSMLFVAIQFRLLDAKE